MVGPMDANIRRQVESLVNDLLYGADRLHIEVALRYLLRLLIQQRQMIVNDRVQQLVQNLGEAAGGLPIGAEMELDDCQIWFDAAYQETDRFIAIYNEWLKKVEDAVSVWPHIVKHGVGQPLPPAPSALQDDE